VEMGEQHWGKRGQKRMDREKKQTHWETIKASQKPKIELGWEKKKVE